MTLVSVSDVDSAIAQLDPVMLAIDQQKGVLSTVDAQTWAGQMSGWSSLKTEWQGYKDASNFLNAWGPELYNAPRVLVQANSYQQVSAQYGALVAKGGGTAPVQPNVNPQPPAPNPASPSSWPWYYWAGAGAAALVAAKLAFKTAIKAVIP